MTLANLAWAAGLIDGEGNISIQKCSYRNAAGVKTPCYCLILRVKMTHRATIERLHSLFRRGTVSHCRRRSARHRDSFNWQVGGADAHVVLAAILPFLFTKRGEANLAMEFRRLPIGRHGSRPLSKAMLAEREEFYQRSRALKRCESKATTR